MDGMCKGVAVEVRGKGIKKIIIIIIINSYIVFFSNLQINSYR